MLAASACMATCTVVMSHTVHPCRHTVDFVGVVEKLMLGVGDFVMDVEAVKDVELVADAADLPSNDRGSTNTHTASTLAL